MTATHHRSGHEGEPTPAGGLPPLVRRRLEELRADTKATRAAMESAEGDAWHSLADQHLDARSDLGRLMIENGLAKPPEEPRHSRLRKVAEFFAGVLKPGFRS